MPTFSVITATYNSAKTIEDTLQSVRAQASVDIEHVIVDGGSTDDTLEIIHRYRSSVAKVISEPDDGIYDAMNKGLNLATGDFTGCLNSDDYFASTGSLRAISGALHRTHADCAWGSIIFVDDYGRPRRKMSGSWFAPQHLQYAIMLPHPAFYARTALLKAAGGFDASYKIAGDFNLIVQLFKNPGLKFTRIKDVITIMRLGGVSTKDMQATRIASTELQRVLDNNGIETSPAKVNLRYVLKAAESIEGRLMALAGARFPVPKN